MSSSPSWMVLATAILAVVGTLSAPVVTHRFSAKREAIQWERQQAQEQARWKRERQERQEQWRREDQERQEQWRREDYARWHQERLAAYSGFLTAARRWERTIRPPILMAGDSRFTLKGDELDGAFVALISAETSAGLFSSPAIGAATTDLVRKAAELHFDLSRGGLDDAAGRDRLGSRLWKFMEDVKDLERLIRRDLGVEASEASEISG